MARIRHIFAIAPMLVAFDAGAAEGWRWEISPYLWAADLGIDVSVHDRQVVDTTIQFEELL